MATTRSILQVLENYQKSRIIFVQTVAELATKPQNVEVLHNSGVVTLLRPLLLDCVPNIQQTASLALSRLSNYSKELAEAIVHEDILIQIVYSLKEQNKYNKKAAAGVVRAIAKHSPALAQAIADAGILKPLILCLEDFDPSIKEVAIGALGNIARHTTSLAQLVVDVGGVSLFVMAIQEPELSLKRTATYTLAEIAKHSPELAQQIVDAGVIIFIAPLLSHGDAKLKREVCGIMSQIAKHTMDLAEAIVAADIFPKIYLLLQDTDSIVRRNAAMVIREVCKHTLELTQLVVATGGITTLIDNIRETCGNERLPGVMALGYMAAFSETLALTIIASEGLSPLLNVLTTEVEDHIKSASAWSLGQIGRHSPIHAKAVAEKNILPALVNGCISKTSSEDLQTKCKKAIKGICDRLTFFPALDSLMQEQSLPEGILKYVLAQIGKIVLHDQDAKTLFVTSGNFARMQEIAIEASTEIKEIIDNVNNAYPIEIVHYYSPGYSKILLEKLTTGKF